MLAKTALTAGAVVVAGVCAFLCIAVDDLSGDGAGGAKKRKSAGTLFSAAASAAPAETPSRRIVASAAAADLYADDRSRASSPAASPKLSSSGSDHCSCTNLRPGGPRIDSTLSTGHSPSSSFGLSQYWASLR
eukprot:COSAG06_NODE_1101_length_10696_cov_15.719260_2_plen_133_part_00